MTIMPPKTLSASYVRSVIPRNYTEALGEVFLLALECQELPSLDLLFDYGLESF